MNTNQLLAALNSYPAGTKFSHPHFTEDEYIYKDPDSLKIKTEEGYEVIDEFWDIRKDWDGWYVKEQEASNDNHTGAFSQPEYHDYYLTNYYTYRSDFKPEVYCSNCKLLKDDHTCPYSRKPIKLISSSHCKYGIQK